MSSETTVKRFRLSENSKSSFVFGSNPDRKLLIDDTIFHVQSDILIEHCGYFRPIFTSDFKEKEQEIIPINVFNAEEMEMFMCALYKTDEFKLRGRNLEAVVEMFNYFQAVTFLLKLLEENNVFDRFTEKLLDLSARFGLIELTVGWKCFRVFFGEVCKKLFIDVTKPKITGAQSQNKLLDHRSVFNYNNSRHRPETENKYVRLMRKYQLEHLKVEIVEYAIRYFRLHKHEYEIICSRYINTEDPEEMNQLKDRIERFLLNTFEKYGTCNIAECGEYLETSTTYGMNEMTNKIEQFLLKQLSNCRHMYIYECREYLATSTYYKLDEVTKAVEHYLLAAGFHYITELSDSWKNVKQYYFSEEAESDFPDCTKLENNTTAVFHLSGLLEDVDQYGLTIVKEKLEDFLIADVRLFLETPEAHNDSIITDLLHFTKGSAKLKEIIQTFAIKQFDDRKKWCSFQYYTTSLEQCKEYDLSDLEAFIHSHLSSQYNVKPYFKRRCMLNDEQIAELAFVFQLKDLANHIENVYVTCLQSNMGNVHWFAELLMSYEMPVLKNCVENLLLDKLEAADFDLNLIGKCCNYAYYGNMEKLKEKLDIYLVTDFEATRNFRYIEFAFLDNPFVKYSNTVLAVLSSSHISDPIIKAADKYISDLRIEDQNTIFKTLRKVVHYEDE